MHAREGDQSAQWLLLWCLEKNLNDGFSSEPCAAQHVRFMRNLGSWWAPLRRNREARTVVVFSAAAALGAVAANRVLTQVVSPTALGEFYLLMNLVHWISLPVSGAYVFITRHWAEARAHRSTRRFVERIKQGILWQCAVALAGTVVIVFVHLGLTSPAAAVSFWLVCVGQAVAQALDPVQSADRRRIAAGMLSLLGPPLRPVFLAGGALLLAVHSGAGLLAVQAAHSLLLAVATVVALILLVRRHPDPPGEPITTNQFSLRSFIAFSLPYLLGNALNQGSASAERWGLARLAHPRATALFVQSIGFAMVAAGAVAGVLNSYFQPIITQRASGGLAPLRSAAPAIRKYLILSLTLLALVVAGGSTLSKFVTWALFGPRFAAVARLLPWSLAGASLFMLGQALSIIPYVLKETVLPNAAAMVARASYICMLLLCRPAAGAALTYVRLFAIGHGLYALLMLAVAARSSVRAGLAVPQSGQGEGGHV